MDLSNYVYDVYEELKTLDKNTSLPDKEKFEAIFRALETVERAKHTLRLKTETIGLHLRALRGEREKYEGSARAIDGEVEATRKKTKAISASLKEVKDIEEKIESEYCEKERIAAEQMEEIRGKLAGEYEHDPETLKALKAKNEELKGRIQAIIDKLKAKEEEYQTNMNGLEKTATESGKEAQEKFNEYSAMAKELQMVLTKKQYLKIKAETMLQRLRIFRLKVPEFREVIALKQRQYAKYKADIRDIVEKGHDNYVEKQRIEETVRKMNVLFMDLLQENEALKSEYARAQNATDDVKRRCKEMQMRALKKS